MPAAVEVSNQLIPEEQEQPTGKNYLPTHSLKDSGGAFHEKKAKNQKTNLGGSYRREIKAKYKKPIKRSGKKKKRN